MRMRTIGAPLLIAGLWAGVTPADDASSASPAIQPLLGEIRLRQAELDRRERELVERERAHIELEELLESQFEEIKAQRQTIESRLEAWEAASGERIRQLAKIYSAMKPAKAARLLEELEANLATQILRKMKHKQSAAILERIDADRALAVSRKVAHPLSFEPTEPPKGDG